MASINLDSQYVLTYDENGNLQEVRTWASDGDGEVCVVWAEDDSIDASYAPDVHPLAAEYFAYIESLPIDRQAAIQRLEQEQPSPNWGGFRMAMLMEPAYRSITEAANIHSVQRLENAISMSAEDIYVPAVVMLWNEMVEGLLLPDGAIEQWQAVANATFVPLKWRTDGSLFV